jgi:predicted NUDIX family phosphoesterase
LEFVWVVKREDLFRGRTPHGLERLDPAAWQERCALIRERGFFVERRHAERDWTLKQPIPYCVVVRGGEVLRTRRLAKGGERRLHGKLSIGIGGHINPEDAPDAAADLLANGLRREIEEELVVRGGFAVRPLGLLNDDTTEVGAVHVGLVHAVEIEGDVAIRETDALEGAFVGVEELAASCRADRAGYETWSALVIESGALASLRGTA